MTPREQRIAEAVRDACAAEFQRRADAIRLTVLVGSISPKERRRATEIVRGLDATAATIRALDVAAVVATVGDGE